MDGPTTPTGKPTVVCLLDVLGFEQRFRNLGLPAIKAKYDRLVEHVNSQRHAFDIVTSPEGHAMMGVMLGDNAYFSDSLLFWQIYAPPFFSRFTRQIMEAICVGLEIELPLRGALTVGEVILDRQSGVFLGLPLVEAARIEKIQQWIGASFGPSFMDLRFSRFDPETVFPYKDHYKKDVNCKAVPPEWKTEITLDWPRHWRESRKSDLYAAIEGLRDKQHAEYYDATVAFAAKSEANHDWFRNLPTLP